MIAAIVYVVIGFVIGVLVCNTYWKLRTRNTVEVHMMQTNGPEHW